MNYKAYITENCRKLYSVSIGKKPFRDNLLEPGTISIIVRGNNFEELILEGTYNKDNGLVSGLSKIYKMKLFENKESIDYTIINNKRIEILLNEPIKNDEAGEKYETVFEKKNLKYLHFEPFRPENLNNWVPKTETDIYMIFGVVEDYTEFKYCCGTNAEILKGLGFKYDAEISKPDAILINRSTSEYMIAEFKMKSSQFKSNHKKEDIDVLVVWKDDEVDRNVLPKHIVELSSIAKNAALDQFNSWNNKLFEKMQNGI